MQHISLKKFSHVLKQEGTSRLERYVPALHESTALLDTRKLQDFILYMQQYSKNVLFVNTDRAFIDHNESWEDIFVNDPVLLIAGIASLDIKKVKQEYDELSKTFQNAKTVGVFAELVKVVFSNFSLINNWYLLSSPGSMLQKDLHLYIGSYLQREMESIREMLFYIFDHWGDDAEDEKKKNIHARNELTRKELERMDVMWKLNQKEKIALREKIFSGGNEADKLISASVILNKAFETVYHAIGSIAERSGKYFDETIQQKQDHNPHVALIIAFIKLFEYQQAELNKLPARILDFYYKDVLRIKERNAVPDQAYIIFELVKGFDTVFIKKGTQLSAGKDKQNNELLYKTDKDAVVNKAKVTHLRSLFAEKNGKEEIVNFYSKTVIENPGQVYVSSDEKTAAAKMFGDADETSIAETGFAITSSQLFLANGERNVVILLHATGDIEPPEVLQAGTQTNDFDKSLIRLLLTAEKGWLDSNNSTSGITITSLKKIGNSAIELRFSVSITQTQAIIAFDKKIHDGSFNTAFPVMKCMLNFRSEKITGDIADKLIHQLNILQTLQVSIAEITVQVGSIQSQVSFDGVRDLALENDESILSSKKPFYPFSPVPKVSSSFYLGCKDLYYKKIQNLSLNIEWLLPENFRNYYQNYNPPYDSNKFIASLSYLDKSRWKKHSDVSVIDVNSGVPQLRIIKMNLEKLLNESNTDLPDNDGSSAFDNIKQNGTIRLKLQYPDFGHSIYPQLITSTVMDKAASKSGNIDYYKLIKKKLHDDIFTIELPRDITDRRGSLKVIYDILNNVNEDVKAKNMLINALSDIISKNNDIDVVYKKMPGNAQDTIAGEEEEDKGSEMIVHDQNFGEKILRFLKKPFSFLNDVHDDKDKQDSLDIVEDLEGDILKKADFVLPSKEQMNALIINEVNKTINQTVANAVGYILEERAEKGSVDPNRMHAILKDEFDKAKKVINDIIAKKIAMSLSSNEIPPPPYSPLINTISLNYVSTKKMSRTDGDKIFHLTALGGTVETTLWNSDNSVNGIVAANENLLNTNYILPQVLVHIPGKRDKNTSVFYMQGMLFIGIADLLPNQNLSLLFQFSEGTRTNDKIPPEVYWFYLKKNKWTELQKENIISDGTYQLQATGIIEFSIPAGMDNINTCFDIPSQYWLCAAVANDADAFPDITDIKAQALTVTFVDYINNPKHLAFPLEALKIKTLVDEVTGIKKITQPVSSFNGKLAEKDDQYSIRVSERLRHKGRAITNWDYESLVLEEFPSFFKVKCLNNYYDGHFAAGHVTIVPIADLTNKNYAGSDMLLPKTNYIDLKKIEVFLSTKCSPFVKIHAINPKIEHVQVSCKVKFKTGVNKGFYLQKLNEDLINFLTPWAKEAGNISFSAKVYASSVIKFIDQRDYVDYVQDLIMLQYSEDEKGVKTFVRNTNKLSPFALVETKLTTDHSLLVSAPKHLIDLDE